MIPVEAFIARRYLVSKRKIRFINVIGSISIVGITIGVAALFVALSVFNGFNSVVTSVLVGFDPHIRIEKRGNITAEELTRLESILERHSRIKAYSPFVSGKAMLVARSFNRVVFIRGIDESRIGEVSGLQQNIVLGNLHLRDSTDMQGIVIGLTLADRLAALIGEKIVIVSPAGMQSTLTGIGAPQTQKFQVAGIYESNNRDYDLNYAYISIQAAQDLFLLHDRYNGVEMRLDDFHHADAVKRDLEREIPPEYTIATWYDLHQDLYSVMQIERWSAYVLLSLIIAVATFNMLGSLTMSVVEKRRDIGVLKSLGMSANRIARMFMFEGVLIGAVGTIAGLLLGLAVVLLQMEYQLFPLDPTVYIIPAIPVEIRWTDFVAIGIASMGLSCVAAYYPARRAATTVPVEALRWE
jgi:lipoprotein-releasing system permease protein